MSHFIQKAIHPITGDVEDATWCDPGWRTRKEWTVKFPDGSEWPESRVAVPDEKEPKDG